MKTNKLSIEFFIKTPSYRKYLKKSSSRHTQKAIEVCEDVLSDFLKTHSKIKRIELYLSLIGDTRMKKINQKFRHKNKTTDVLSFPIEEDFRNLNNLRAEYILLGDVLIAGPVCYRQARQFGISFEREFIHLLIHGFLHLMGYDHERSFRDEKIMFDLEHFLLSKITKKLPNL